MTRTVVIFVIAGIVLIAMFLLNVFCGAVDIPMGSAINILMGKDVGDEGVSFIVLYSRLPQAFTAMLTGGALAVCGLMMQTIFRNPLADPSILGLSSGAGLGVALVTLLLGGSFSLGAITLTGFWAVLIAAFFGAMIVASVMFFLSTILRSGIMLLIVGVMIGYLTSSVIMLLNYFATTDGVRAFTMWGMGNFSSVSLERLPLFAFIVVVCIAASMLLVKPLNILVLGQQYASNLGVNVRVLRNEVLVITGLLTALTTAYCGPIAFVGLTVPHITRIFLNTDDFKLLLPVSVLVGAILTLACNVVSTLPVCGGVIPINAVTPIIGAPIVIYIMTKRNF